MCPCDNCVSQVCRTDWEDLGKSRKSPCPISLQTQFMLCWLRLTRRESGAGRVNNVALLTQKSEMDCGCRHTPPLPVQSTKSTYSNSIISFATLTIKLSTNVFGKNTSPLRTCCVMLFFWFCLLLFLFVCTNSQTHLIHIQK